MRNEEKKESYKELPKESWKKRKKDKMTVKEKKCNAK